MSRWTLSLIGMRKDQAILGTRNSDEIGASVFILIAKEDFVLDGHDDDRIELKALALMDGQDLMGHVLHLAIESAEASTITIYLT